MSPPPAAAPAAAIGWRGLSWLLAPPLAVLLLRALLQALADADSASLQPLRPATLVSDPAQAMWAAARPTVLALLGVLGLALLLRLGLRPVLRRWGWVRLRPWVRTLWLLACLGAGAALVASHLNRAGRQPLPAQDVRVLLVGEVPASARGPGGAEVYFELPGAADPMRLLAEGQPATAFAPGRAAGLRWQAGRWWGRWGQLTPASGG